MKKITSLFIAFIIFLLPAAMAKEVNIKDIVAYINNDVNFHNSMNVYGSIYSAKGNVNFDNAGGNNVFGNITVKKGNLVSIPQYANPQISGEIIYAEQTEYPFSKKDIIEEPSLENVIESYVAAWYPKPVDICESAYIKDIIIKSTMTVDTTKGDIYIVTDSIKFEGSGNITVKGNNHLYLFLKSDLNISGSSKINENGDFKNIGIFVSGDINIGGSAAVNAIIYSKSKKMCFNGSGTLNGNIFSSGESFEIAGNGIVNGGVYIPQGVAVIHSSGNVNGVVVADSLEMYGNGKITYSETIFDAPHLSEKNPSNEELIPSNPVVRPDITELLSNDYAYIFGYDDNHMAAEQPVTRAEASAMLHRLIKQNGYPGGYEKSDNNSFSDLKTNQWYYTALEYMRAIGVYNSNNGKNPIKADKTITRGEAAKLFTFSFGLSKSENVCNFSDLDNNNKYYEYINSLVAKGYMQGDKNSTLIRPDDNITRAEFVKIYNKAIGRDERYDINTDINGNVVKCKYKDLLNNKNKWYYEDMMRATNSFTDFKVDFSKRQDRNELDEFLQ